MVGTIFCNIILFLFPFHSFFVSFTDINFNVKSQSVEICSRVFTDDLEKAYRAKNNKMIDFSETTYKAEADKFLTAYFHEKIKIAINNKPESLYYLGYETNEDAVWIYFQIKSVSVVKSMRVTNTILYDMIDSQSNIMQVTVGSNKQNTKLDNPSKTAVFNF